MHISFYDSINEKIPFTAFKKSLVLAIKLSINQAANDILPNPSVKTFRIKTEIKLESLVDVSDTEVEISGSECEKKTNFEKTAFKDLYCN